MERENGKGKGEKEYLEGGWGGLEGKYVYRS